MNKSAQGYTQNQSLSCDFLRLVNSVGIIYNFQISCSNDFERDLGIKPWLQFAEKI